MSDGYTYTNAQSDEGLTLEALNKMIKQMELIVPRLLYHCWDYMPVLNAKGEPMVIQVSPHLMDAHTLEFWKRLGVEEYIVFHSDNLPYVKRACAGLFRLEPLPVVKREERSE